MSTYRVEWPCCDSVTETQSWEPERCPFCELTETDAELTATRSLVAPSFTAAIRAILAPANAAPDPALLALARLGAKLFDRAWIKSVGFVNEGGLQDDLDRDTVAFGLVRYEAPGDFQMAPGIADAIAALLAPDGAGEVAP